MKKKKQQQRLITNSNSKILHDTMVTLGALKEQIKLNNLPIHEIQVHLLDKDGDGIILCLEYDELNGELKKTFHNTEEYYDEYDEEQPPYYYGEEFGDSTDPCISPENVAARFEEVISEEYDEIFHNSSDDEEPPPLLN